MHIAFISYEAPPDNLHGGIATYIGQAIGWYKAGQPAGWIMSIVGAMILLLLYRVIFKRKT